MVLLILVSGRAILNEFVVPATSGNEKLTRPEHAGSRGTLRGGAGGGERAGRGRYSMALITCLIRV